MTNYYPDIPTSTLVHVLLFFVAYSKDNFVSTLRIHNRNHRPQVLQLKYHVLGSQKP